MPEQAGFDEHYLWQVREKYGERFKDPYLEINGDSVEQLIGKYGPDMYTNYAIDFIDRHKEKSFFLYYPMALTHDPFQPTPDNDDYDEFDSSKRKNDTTYFRNYVAYMDKVIGRIIDKLEAEGLRDNTLVLFTGDNGTDRDVISTWRGQRIRGNKGYPTDAGTHVPLIGNWPGTIKPGTTSDQLVDFTDFMPTLMETAQAKIPDGQVADGKSFLPVLLDEGTSGREWVFCHYAPQWGKFENARFVHNGEWKLYESGTAYHIANDPEEQSPVSPDQVPSDLLSQFQEVLSMMNN